MNTKPKGILVNLRVLRGQVFEMRIYGIRKRFSDPDYSICPMVSHGLKTITMDQPQREGAQRQALVTPHNRPASATPVTPEH
jgi:hypothetical protein